MLNTRPLIVFIHRPHGYSLVFNRVTSRVTVPFTCFQDVPGRSNVIPISGPGRIRIFHVVREFRRTWPIYSSPFSHFPLSPSFYHVPALPRCFLLAPKFEGSQCPIVPVAICPTSSFFFKKGHDIDR